MNLKDFRKKYEEKLGYFQKEKTNARSKGRVMNCRTAIKIVDELLTDLGDLEEHIDASYMEFEELVDE